MSDPIDFLRARYAEEELWAIEASRRNGGEYPAGGVHWHWVEPDTDNPVEVDPSRGTTLTDEEENFRFSLRSVEEFSTPHSGCTLPQFALYSVEEVPVAVAGHIVRHDPAHVLTDIGARRRLIELHALVYRDVSWLAGDGEEEMGEVLVCGHCVPRNSCIPYGDAMTPRACATVRLLALAYADHPDYRDEWR